MEKLAVHSCWCWGIGGEVGGAQLLVLGDRWRSWRCTAVGVGGQVEKLAVHSCWCWGIGGEVGGAQLLVLGDRWRSWRCTAVGVGG